LPQFFACYKSFFADPSQKTCQIKPQEWQGDLMNIYSQANKFVINDSFAPNAKLLNALFEYCLELF